MPVIDADQDGGGFSSPKFELLARTGRWKRAYQTEYTHVVL